MRRRNPTDVPAALHTVRAVTAVALHLLADGYPQARQVAPTFQRMAAINYTLAALKLLGHTVEPQKVETDPTVNGAVRAVYSAISGEGRTMCADAFPMVSP